MIHIFLFDKKKKKKKKGRIGAGIAEQSVRLDEGDYARLMLD